jgi:sulfur carrier protein ThiS
MRVTVKLFALLSRYLPAGARDNAWELEVAEDATPTDVFRQLNLPQQYCHLVLINGLFIPPSERQSHRLREHDALAVWPPVAGG